LVTLKKIPWSDEGGGVHDVLSATHTDTLAAAVVAGDIIIGNATPKWARLAKGTVNYVLKMGASLPAWAQVAHSELSGVTADQHHAQAHDHLNDHLKPTYLGKIPAIGGVSDLYLYCLDADDAQAHNRFCPSEHLYGYLGSVTKHWYGLYVSMIHLEYDLRMQSGGLIMFPDVASCHATLRPTTANYGHIGTSTYYLYDIYSNYLYYKTHGPFDALDDIALLRRIKSHPTNMDQKTGRAEVDWSTVPDEIKAYEPEDVYDKDGNLIVEKGFHDLFDVGAVNGLLMGAIKQLADKVDALELQVKALSK
jgi:hypothetical protein